MASIYLDAGRIVDEVRSRQKGLKDALYASDSAVPIQKLKALVCKTLEAGDALQAALDAVLADGVGSPGVALCMLYDLLLSQHKKVLGGGSLKRLLLSNRAQLQKHFEHKHVPREPSQPSKHYYLRLNALAARPADLSHIQHARDPIVPQCVKVCGADIDWTRDIAPLVNSGSVSVQDRSSQLAAHAAFKENTGGVVMEVCAAPGSKTSHLIAMASPTVRKVIAVEKDPKRCRTLLERLELLCGPLRDTTGTFRVKDRFPTSSLRNRRIQAFASNNVEIVVRCEDFLVTTCSDYDEATTVVLDPSCSGSGLREHTDAVDETRLKTLAQFQCKMLSKVLSLASVHTVCYSTCSVHREENEDVVEKCLQGTKWAATDPLPFKWPDPDEYAGIAGLCVHSKPAVHDCRGFFLARLKRPAPPPRAAVTTTEVKESPERRKKRKRKWKEASAVEASRAQQSSKKRKRKGVVIILKRT